MALLAALIGLAGCSAGHPKPTPPTVPATAAPTTSAGPLPPALLWNGCPGHQGWDCASLTVPLDHRAPGTTITIALSRHPATVAAQRVGSLLLNPGGPGQSGIQFAYDIATIPVFAQLSQHFDLIGFDPRGVGQSTPVHCVDGPTLDRLGHLDPNPTTTAKLNALIAGARELSAGCKAKAGPILGHVSTVDAAADLEDIRIALGDPGLSYLGFSYGTLLGATYANLYPSHVRALALDAAIDPAVDEGSMSIAQAVGFEQNLNAFLAWCGSSPSTCPLRAHGARSLRAAFDSLAARVATAALPATDGRTLGPGEMLFGVAVPLYSPARWTALGTALEQAANGNGSQLLALNDEYTGRHADGTFDNSLESNTAINCLDRPVPPTLDAFKALAARAAAQAPYFGAPVVWGALPCMYWPDPATGKAQTLSAPGAPPIVVVGSTGDPATPYPWSQHLAAELGSGILLTRQGQGHGAYLPSQCVRQAVDNYLIKLVDPPSGLVCSQ